MGDFSQPPEKLLKDSTDHGYAGIHIEQGVPILDRDLNLLHDLVVNAVRGMGADFIGDGSPGQSGGFLITAVPAANDFTITADGERFPATCLVGGIKVSITAALRYSAQTPKPDQLNTPSAARTDLVYLDVWVTEVDGTTDTDLRNEHDVGMQTAVRLKPVWAVRVAENAGNNTTPPALDGHNRYPLATLTRPAGQANIQPEMITDLRQLRLNLADVESRLTELEVALLLPAFAGDELRPRLGKPGDPVTIIGVNLDTPGTTVDFSGHNAQIISQSNTMLKVAVPDFGLAIGQSQNVDITVTTKRGSITHSIKNTHKFSVKSQFDA